MFHRPPRLTSALLLSVTPALALSCGSTREPVMLGDNPTTSESASESSGSDEGSSSKGQTSGGDEDPGDDSPIKLDVSPGDFPPGSGGSCSHGPRNATVSGTVFAPNLEIPISGAVVYVTAGEVEAVPDHVYCDECVDVACADYELTAPDGSFTVPATAGAGQKLVVQKGQFLHVTPIDVAEGDNTVAPEDANLPAEWNPAQGKWAPRIAVVQSYTDTLHNILAKIGMGMETSGTLVNGSEMFDLVPQADGGALLDDLEAMRQYHIIFVPCMAQSGMGGLSPTRIANIQQWVAEGGKWYVTDWANEYLYEPFPNYQTLHGQDVSDPDLGIYSTTGTVTDPDLLAWLEALPAPLKDIGGGHPNLLSLPSVELVDNWSGIDEIPSVMAEDAEGNMVDVGHHAWVEGPCPVCSPSNVDRPMTVSAEYGCGRMMFSTYHTDEGAHAGLTPQELILLYIILEIGVCHDEPPPGVPPG